MAQLVRRRRGARDMPAAAGLDYDAMLGGGVHALYVMGADPARHATPEQLARLEALDFLVVQDLFLTETAKRATVVLPAVAYTEKDGTFTNTERAVQVVRRAMMELPGARADWQILTQRGERAGPGLALRLTSGNSGGDRARRAALCGRLAAWTGPGRHALAVARGRGWREWQTSAGGQPESHLGDAGARCSGQR